jgi:hypothetical protein
MIYGVIFSDFKRSIFGGKASEHGPSVLPSHGLLGFSSFLNGIFLAEKCPNTDLRSFLAMDFWDFNRFLREYFWLKSVRTRTFGPSSHGLLGFNGFHGFSSEYPENNIIVCL